MSNPDPRRLVDLGHFNKLVNSAYLDSSTVETPEGKAYTEAFNAALNVSRKLLKLSTYETEDDKKAKAKEQQEKTLLLGGGCGHE